MARYSLISWWLNLNHRISESKTVNIAVLCRDHIQFYVRFKARKGIRGRERIQFCDQMFSRTQLIRENYFNTNTLRTSNIHSNVKSPIDVLMLNFEHWTEENLFHPLGYRNCILKPVACISFPQKRKTNIGFRHRCKWVVCIQFDNTIYTFIILIPFYVLAFIFHSHFIRFDGYVAVFFTTFNLLLFTSKLCLWNASFAQLSIGGYASAIKNFYAFQNNKKT